VALLEVEFADRPGERKLRPMVVVAGEQYNSTGPDMLVVVNAETLSRCPT